VESGLPRTLLGPLDHSRERGWTLKVDGKPMFPRQELTLVSRFGRLTYGAAPGGYDTWGFSEVGGGGAVVLPFVKLDGQWLVGLVEQERHNLGGFVLNAPRGFIDPGEVHAAAAARELSEEMGIVSTALIELPGDPVCCNSTFFECSEADLGVRFYGLRVAADMLVLRGGVMTLADHAIGSSESSRSHRLAEQIGAARFVTWQVAASVRCMFTIAAIGRWLAWRAEEGDVIVP